MAEQIRSRGPNGQGVWVDREAGISLGHRRLSIIDLSTKASQPMESACGRFVLSYNGEVYNFQELRQELEKKGISFKSHSDTEVILEACVVYGVKEAVQKLIGMFAFALWDKRNQVVYLVRDRLGIKPLYWGIQNQTLFFGSQLKSFCPHPAWSPHLNSEALALYFQYKYVPSPASIYRDIFKLEPGSILTVGVDQTVKEEKFWGLESVITQNLSKREQQRSLVDTTEKLDIIIKDSVRRILISDVPIGCFLSGGIDSSLVAATMQSLSSSPIQTFSIGFERAEYNEAPQAKKISQFLKTDHHEEILTEKKCLDIVPSLATFYDEPFADSSQVPTYLVSALAKETVTVVLSGDGGDELFGGYNRYKAADQLWKTLSRLPEQLKALGASALSSSPPTFFNSINALLPTRLSQSNLPHKMEKISRILKASSEEEFYQSLVKQDSEINKLLTFPPPRSLSLPTLEGLSFVENMQYWDIKTYLPDDILAKVDRASMAVGLEARVPLLDHRLVDFSWSLPQNLKIRGGETKWILRQLLYKKIPPHLFSGPKKGFAIPIGEWLRGPLKKWAEEMVYSCSSDYIRPSFIQQLWEDHLSTRHDHHEILWSYLMYTEWSRSYKHT